MGEESSSGWNVMQKPGKNKPYSIETFHCKRCGRCCTGEGYVNLDADECETIAKFLETPLEKFLEYFTIEMTGFERWLVDAEGDDRPCVFLLRDDDGIASCRIEAVKPRQCRDFPYKWRRADAKDWCKGLNEK